MTGDHGCLRLLSWLNRRSRRRKTSGSERKRRRQRGRRGADRGRGRGGRGNRLHHYRNSTHHVVIRMRMMRVMMTITRVITTTRVMVQRSGRTGAVDSPRRRRMNSGSDPMTFSKGSRLRRNRHLLYREKNRVN
jgi:hypothetical protein